MKTEHIDEAMLACHSACAAGVDWFRSRWGTKAVSFDLGLATLLDEERLDYLAWFFYHVPALRRQAGPAVCERLMGPRHALLAALADNLPRFPWLAPKATRPAELQSLVDTHLRRMEALGFPRPGAVVRVEVLPLADAWARVASLELPTAGDDGAGDEIAWRRQWVTAWTAAGRSKGEGAGRSAQARSLMQAMAARPAVVFDRVWWGFRAELEAGLSSTLAAREGVVAQTRAAIGDAAGHVVYLRAKERFFGASLDEAWRLAETLCDAQAPGDDTLPRSIRAACGAVDAMARRDAIQEALWAMADVQAPSPFAPLLGLWEMGVWPAGLAGDRFVVGYP